MTAHYSSLTDIQLAESWLTIGTFDGVHLGHQQLVRSLVEQAHAESMPAVVVTFHPHPTLVLRGGRNAHYLTLPEKRAELLGELGIDFVITHPFNKEVSQLTAGEFIARLHKSLAFNHLWIGHDFALGKDREGNPERLGELGQQYGFEVKQISAYQLDGEVVSSSLIRALLRDGDAEGAARYLGRPYSVQGEVIGGDQRGKSLGFATANLDVSDQMVGLNRGVYACQALISGTIHPAVTNIGYRPTFDQPGGAPRIEAHLLDFEQDIYGQIMELFFLSRLRGEKKFDEIQELQDQVQRDITLARKILGAD
jgi:riboflavin kinase/FMN adenylyltransferase